MVDLLHGFIERSASNWPDNVALEYQQEVVNYEHLAQFVRQAARAFVTVGLKKQDRVCIFLPKCIENVMAIFGVSAAGGVFVPLNPGLKAQQVLHILNDCEPNTLVTSKDRLNTLIPGLFENRYLKNIVLIDDETLDGFEKPPVNIYTWHGFLQSAEKSLTHRVIDLDVASLLYTSGSTGRPKGVILSHRNMVTGANSVVQYLQNNQAERILSVLPLSFDYGFSQLSTAFSVGARVVLMNYMLPMQIVKAIENSSITGLAAVPPLWSTLAQLRWSSKALENLRYITSSGGSVPENLVRQLESLLPHTKIFLMYGLTEAFRSTYLPPEQISERPGSIGKAIPNADIKILRQDGAPCMPGEAGELVHRGSLVSMGYWNDPENTSRRFKPIPKQNACLPSAEVAVWSGDIVRMDDEGYIYFIGRNDDLIKSSGYRVSPNEVEEILYQTGLVSEAVAFGVPHEVLGHSITVVIVPEKDIDFSIELLLNQCKKNMPPYMVPSDFKVQDNLPRNSNGKFDRKLIYSRYVNKLVGSV